MIPELSRTVSIDIIAGLYITESPPLGRGKIKGYGGGEENQKGKQGQIHGKTVMDGWAGAEMQKPLPFQIS